MPSTPTPHLEPVQLLNPADEVVLQVEDAQMAAQLVDQLDALDALLVQSNLLQRRQAAVVVLRPAHEELLRDSHGAKS